MFGLSKKERFEKEKRLLWADKKRTDERIAADEDSIKNDGALYKFQKQKKLKDIETRKRWNWESYWSGVDKAKEKYGITDEKKE